MKKRTKSPKTQSTSKAKKQSIGGGAVRDLELLDPAAKKLKGGVTSRPGRRPR
jgi:hypothetical protein